MADINCAVITLDECLKLLELKGRRVAINDGRITEIIEED